MNNRLLDIGGFDIYDDNLYFYMMSANGIFNMNIKTGKVRYMTSSEKYQFFDGYLYRDVHLENNKIWFAPYGADDILIYDMQLNISKYISVPQLAGHGRKQVKFCGLYDADKQFIMVPAEYPAILKIDKETFKISVIKWEEKLLRAYPDFIKINKYIGITSWNYEVYNKKLYLFAGNISIRYDIETDELDFLQISNERRIYSGLARFEDTFALADRSKGELQIWREEENRILKVYDLGYQGEEAGDDGGPIWVFQINQGIVIAQSKDNFLFFLDYKSKIQKIRLDIDVCGSNENFFVQIKQKQNYLIIPSAGQNKILIVNTDNWMQRCVQMDFDNYKTLKKEIEHETYFIENAMFYQLNDLIRKLYNCEKDDIQIRMKNNYGKSIYMDISQ